MFYENNVTLKTSQCSIKSLNHTADLKTLFVRKGCAKIRKSYLDFVISEKKTINLSFFSILSAILNLQ